MSSSNMAAFIMFQELQNSLESAINPVIADNPEEVDSTIKSDTRPLHHAESTPSIDGNRTSRPSVIQGPMQLTDNPRFPSYGTRVPTRHPTPFSAHPNGIPMAAYMDPMYIPRHQTPAMRHPMSPYMYPNMSAPLNPFEQQRMRLALLPVANTPSPSGKEAESQSHPKMEKEVTSKTLNVNLTSVQKLPGINTITSSFDQYKQSSESQPPINGFPPGSTAGFTTGSLPHPPQHPPIQMLPGHNGQMYYRYCDPIYRGNQTSAGMYFNHPNRPPFPVQYTSRSPYSGPVSPNVSPKRKRRKTSKSVIESHSAHLAAVEDTALDSDKLCKTSQQVNNNPTETNVGGAEDTIIKSGSQ